LGSFGRPRTETQIRFGIVADPHVPVDEHEHAKLYKPTTMLERVVADSNRRDIDYLFSVGDLTREGMSEEYGALDDVLDALEVPFASVPGNHDVPNDFDTHEGLSIERFQDRYTPGGLPFALDVGGLCVLGLDSASAAAVADSHDGYVPEPQLAWLDEALDGANEAIVLVHHNLPAAIDQFDEYRQVVDPSIGRPPVLRGSGAFVDVLSQHDVSLVFSGHLHIPGVATTASVREVLVPSTCTYPQGYLLVETDTSGTDVRFVPVANRSEAVAAYHQRCVLRPKAAALAGMAATRFSTLPFGRDDD
jgi:3',5'-cyclic AMP phosphodiesterase CpdA